MPPDATREATVVAEQDENPFGAKHLRNRTPDAHAHLRIGMGLIALAFPVSLWLGGVYLTDTPLQNSMSAYYHTPMRDLFVGTLCVLGVFLYLYKGFSRKENLALDLAGVCAVGVGIFPMGAPPGTEPTPSTVQYLHAACAVLIPTAMAYVCLIRAADTLHLSRRRGAAFRRAYKLLGAGLIVFSLATGVLALRRECTVVPEEGSTIFILELLTTWTFGAYWLLKSLEFHGSRADRTRLEHDRSGSFHNR